MQVVQAGIKIQKTTSKSSFAGSATSKLMTEAEIKNGFGKADTGAVVVISFVIDGERFACGETGGTEGGFPVQAGAETVDDISR